MKASWTRKVDEEDSGRDARAPARGRPVRGSAGVPPALLTLVILAFGVFGMQQVNVTWDEAIGDFFWGERYLHFFLHWDTEFLQIHSEPFPEDRRPSLGSSPSRVRPLEHYAVANLLAALTSEIVTRGLGWMDVYDGFHALNLWLTLLFVPLFHRFVRRRSDAWVASAAVLFLYGMPRFVAQYLANIKDYPLTVFWCFAVMAFFVAWERGSERLLLFAGLLVGLALGTKANSLFYPLVPGAVVLVCGVPDAWPSARRFWIRSAQAAVVAVATFFLTWPYLWLSPKTRLLLHFEYVTGRASKTPPEHVASAFDMLLLTTPPFVLVAAALGLGCLVRPLRRRDPRAVLLLACVVAPLVRYLIPSVINFDGVRHFLELFPALAVLAAVGVVETSRRLLGLVGIGSERRTTERRTTAAAGVLAGSLALLASLPGLWQVARTHPFQVCYFNAIAGGYDGARARDVPQAADYWGASYRLGLRWLNENAERDAYLAVPVVEHAVELVEPLRLRDDLRLLDVTRSTRVELRDGAMEEVARRSREAPLYVMFVHREDWSNALMRDCTSRLEPVRRWTLDGAPVLSIYRYRPPGAGQIAQSSSLGGESSQR